MDFARQNYMLLLFKSFANASRLKILQLLLEMKEPMTVTQIVERIDIEQGNLSNHLIRMRKDGILQAKQAGKNMLYSIKDKNVDVIFRVLK